jgi:hypothetical protein
MTEEPQQQETIDAALEDAVTKFVDLDDQQKAAKLQFRERKKVILKHKKVIVDYMVHNKVDRLSGVKGNTQYIECVQKTLKRRATAEQIRDKLAELMSQHVADPLVILEAIQNCGGTYKEWRLSRRTRRINAAALLIAASATGGAPPTGELNKKKKGKPGLKKRKKTLTGAATK